MEESFPLKTFKNTVALLSQNMDYQESQSIAYMVMEKSFQLSRLDITSNTAFNPDDSQILKYQVIMNRLSNHEPIQYILKEADFYGRKFFVNPSVLIPRQETEILIQTIIDFKNWEHPKIADIGTGSGCIACTLNLEIPDTEVHAYDISPEALKVADQNASRLSADVQFSELDVLAGDIVETNFDLIVSNPPYVTLGEKIHMKRNVLEYEPHLALFVSEDDPYIFYKEIIRKAKNVLKPEGVVFFEINEQFGKNVMLLFQHFGFTQPKIHKDLNEKQRFVSAILP